MLLYPYAVPLREDLLEVVDAHDRPLLLMPRAEVLRRCMPHRTVRAALCDDTGHLLLVRGSGVDENPASLLPPSAQSAAQQSWTLPGTRVRAGESREEATLRLIEHHLGLNPALLQIPLQALRAPRPAADDHSATEVETCLHGKNGDQPEKDLREAFTEKSVLYYSLLPRLEMEAALQGKDILLVDRDELLGLATHFGDMLSPGLRQALSKGYLWGALSKEANA